MKTVIVVLLVSVFCSSISTLTRSHAHESFEVDISPQVVCMSSFPLAYLLRERLNLRSCTKNQVTCTYTLTMRKSLSSLSTRDQISLSFGDAYGNQVYIPRLDNPYQRAFTRCSTDTFQVNEPCAYQICYIYVYWRGPDGLRLKRVTIQGYNKPPVKLEYHAKIPSGVWFGFSHCQGGGYRRASS